MALADALADHPDRETFDLPELLRAIEACQACAIACDVCADSDLARDGMRQCIRRCLDCSAICRATASVLSRPAPSGDAWMAQIKACVVACMECAQECEDHGHACCQNCAEACRECEQALQQLIAVAS